MTRHAVTTTLTDGVIAQNAISKSTGSGMNTKARRYSIMPTQLAGLRVLAFGAALASAVMTLTGCGSPHITASYQSPDMVSGTPQSAAMIYFNADILTLVDTAPVANAVAVRDGRILAVGELKDVRAAAGPRAALRDMSGRTIVPGLIDAHGHFASVARVLSLADLQPPPSGGVSNMAELLSALQDWRNRNPAAAWIQGVGYDDSLLAEHRHPTRDDLDTISEDIPIALTHVSGHLMSCNSACLAASGITAATEDPKGGVIRRRPGSREPNGVLEEAAIQLVIAKLPRPTPAQTQADLRKTQDYYASYGITTVQEGGASQRDVADLRTYASKGDLHLDVVAYVQHTRLPELAPDFAVSRTYDNHFRIGGIKLTLDGSPQGKTAWLTEPYLMAPDGLPKDYRGYATLDDAQVDRITGAAFARNIQVLMHANGDAAIDQMIGAVSRAEAANGPGDRRPVMIHAQTVREDQLDLMKAKGIIPSFFVTHTYFWGDWHRDSVFGEPRAVRISPLKSAGARGLPFTIHNDSPVVPPDMMRLMWSAVNRTTRSERTLGPEQRISPLDALKAITKDAAYQYFEEDQKGTIEVGKLADFTVLSQDPLQVQPDRIKDIRVLETIKEGATIFLR
ncbi:MAG: amidohydrolase [Hyphomonadaceae bacterium]